MRRTLAILALLALAAVVPASAGAATSATPSQARDTGTKQKRPGERRRCRRGARPTQTGERRGGTAKTKKKTSCPKRTTPKGKRTPSREQPAGGGPARDGGATPSTPSTPSGGGGSGDGAGTGTGGSPGDTGGSTGGGGGTTPELNAIGVRAYDRSGVFTFETTRSTVRTGALTVSFRNYDSDEHNLWVEGTAPLVTPAKLVDDLPADQSATTTVTLAAGAYRFFCTVPGHSSMTKAFTVSG